MAKKKPYFDNNWDEYKQADDDMFIPHTFEELMSWKVASWELPSSVCCLIRVTHSNSKKTKEYVYRRRADAQRKVEELIATPDIEFTVCDHEAIHHLTPEETDV